MLLHSYCVYLCEKGIVFLRSSRFVRRTDTKATGKHCALRRGGYVCAVGGGLETPSDQRTETTSRPKDVDMRSLTARICIVPCVLCRFVPFCSVRFIRVASFRRGGLCLVCVNARTPPNLLKQPTPAGGDRERQNQYARCLRRLHHPARRRFVRQRGRPVRPSDFHVR